MTSPEEKDRRRKRLKRNRYAAELRTAKYRQQVLGDKRRSKTSRRSHEQELPSWDYDPTDYHDDDDDLSNPHSISQLESEKDKDDREF